MARGRMISKRLGKSKKIAALKRDRSRFLYPVIYVHADCEGRFTADPEDIKEECLGINLKYSLRQIAESIIDMANVHLITLYEAKGKPYMQFIDFEKHQPGLRKDREAPSEIPNPESVGVSLEDSGVTPSLILNKYKIKLSKERRSMVGIYFDIESRMFVNINKEDIAGWRKAYPACDIEIELLKMKEWIISNWASGKGKKKNWRRFITNWLSKQQDRGGTKGIKRTGELPSDLKAWVEKKDEK